MLKRLTLLLTSGDKSVLFEERSFCSTFRIYIEEETLGFMDVILQWSPSRNFFFFFLLQTMFDWRHVLMMHEIGKSLFAKRIPPPLLQGFLHKYVLIFFPRIIIFHNLWYNAKSCKTFSPDLAKQTTYETNSSETEENKELQMRRSFAVLLHQITFVLFPVSQSVKLSVVLLVDCHLWLVRLACSSQLSHFPIQFD